MTNKPHDAAAQFFGGENAEEAAEADPARRDPAQAAEPDTEATGLEIANEFFIS